MTVLVFAISMLLAVAGAVSVIMGAPIIQLERGWAEVIAGSVALTGGAVTFALGLILLRLEQFHESMFAGAGAEGASVATTPKSIVVDDTGLRPSYSEDGGVGVSAATDASDLAPEPVPALAHDLASGDQPDALPDNQVAGTPDEVEPVSAIIAGTRPVEAPARQAVPEDRPSLAPPETETLFEDSNSRRLASPAPGPDAIRPKDAAAPLSRDWLTRPLLRSRAPRPAPPEPPPLFAGPPDRDDIGSPSVQVSGPALDESESAAPTVDHGRGSDRAPPGVPRLGPGDLAVIGRYKAGASSYTMYSDGSIDVETEGGDTHRFGSMEELKAFIARQERALS